MSHTLCLICGEEYNDNHITTHIATKHSVPYRQRAQIRVAFDASNDNWIGQIIEWWQDKGRKIYAERAERPTLNLSQEGSEGSGADW